MVRKLFKHPDVKGVDCISSNYYKARFVGKPVSEVELVAYIQGNYLYIEKNGKSLEEEDLYKQFPNLRRSYWSMVADFLIEGNKRKCKVCLCKLMGSNSYFLSRLISM